MNALEFILTCYSPIQYFKDLKWVENGDYPDFLEAIGQICEEMYVEEINEDS